MLLRFIHAIVVVLAVGTSALVQAAVRQPNVLFILADQWRAQSFGFAGDTNVQTPNLDRLTSECIQFRNAVAGLPVCCPTRASLLTGQRPLTHGVFLNDVPLRPELPTLAKIFGAADYQTGYIGKWHLNGGDRSAFIPRERRQGFDYWKVLECTHEYSNSFYYADAPEKLKWQGYDAFGQTADACAFVRSHAASAQPFFLFLAWGPPHDPYLTAPEKFRSLYDPAKLILRTNVPVALQNQVRQLLAGYYAHCSALDSCVGQLLQTLDETGLREDTLFVFSADHGDMLGSQGLFKKQKPFDESIRVPLLIRWPRALGVHSRQLDPPINSEDIMPTLLGLCRLPFPPSVEGLDYSGLIRGGNDPSDGATLIQCVAPFGEWERRNGGKEYRGVRTTHYTYVRDLNGPWLLFDNQIDPYQTNNLVGLATQTVLQGKLESILQAKLQAAHDSFRPGAESIAHWGYHVDANGTVPYAP